MIKSFLKIVVKNIVLFVALCMVMFILLHNIIVSIGIIAALYIIWLCSGVKLLIDDKILIQHIISELLIKEYNLKPRKLGFKLFFDATELQMYRSSNRLKYPLAMNDKVVIYKSLNDKVLTVKNTKFPLFWYKINIDSFNGIIKDSKIEKGLVLPYYREVDEKSSVLSYRIVVITDKGQIFHNYPDRSKAFSGVSLFGDLIRFDESVVWDKGDSLYPQCVVTDSSHQIYYPGLPRECYEYHPNINNDFYGNGGFPIRKKVLIDNNEVWFNRFYISRREKQGNPFCFMGGLEYDERMALLGTYRSNTEVGVRICLFVSTDGGREWYVKYEFGDTGDYTFRQGRNKKYGENWGNIIRFDMNNFPTDGSVKVFKRVFRNTKDYIQNELYSKDYIGNIREYSINENGIVIFKTEMKHSLNNGNVIGLWHNKANVWFINDESSKQIELFFKVEVISDNSFILHEFVSNNGRLPCRHIHSINKNKDCYIISTGEIFPNGWEIILSQKRSDNGHNIYGYQNYEIIQLNSREQSVQRIMGMIWDEGNEVIFASDQDLFDRSMCYKDANLLFNRSSLGIFSGNIKDIDDFSKFSCIYDLNEPSYFFKKIMGVIFNCGQRGEFCYSENGGKTWKKRKLKQAIENYTGVFQNGILCGEYIIMLK